MEDQTPIVVHLLRYAFRLLFQLVLFFFLYVLSIGPMFWLWFGAYYADGSKIFFVLYYPLLRLCEENEKFRDFVNTYINWWIT